MDSETTRQPSGGALDLALVERVRAIAAETFDLPRESLCGDSTVGSVEGWDSLGHLRLMMAVEGAFGVRFHTEEIGQPRTIDDLCRLLAAKVP